MFWRHSTPYERGKRREEFLLEVGYLLIIVAAVIGSAAFINWVLPAHPHVATALSIAAWVGIFGVVDTRSRNREMRHARELQDAYQRGLLEATSDDS